VLHAVQASFGHCYHGGVQQKLDSITFLAVKNDIGPLDVAIAAHEISRLRQRNQLGQIDRLLAVEVPKDHG
jgi:hypothetical protein